MRDRPGGPDPARPCFCGRPSIAQGLCYGHYKQQQRGVPFAALRPYVKTAGYWEERKKKEVPS